MPAYQALCTFLSPVCLPDPPFQFGNSLLLRLPLHNVNNVTARAMYLLHLHCSYSVMQSCWKSEPEDRPQFSELVSTISDILESTAGYVELAMSLKSNK